MSRFLDVATKRLKYALSLPERTIRSLASVAGGTSTLLSETLFPEVLRGTTLYKIFIGDTQQFMLEKVAQIQKEKTAGGELDTRQTDDEANAGDDYIQRKMVGGALETAGLFAMHFSPLWVFAIAGDAAAGSRLFLDRLVAQLKDNGVVAPDTEVDGLADLLAAIQETSRQSAAAIDKPPLSREQINELAQEMTEGYGQVFAKATNLVPRLETIWGQMVQLARKENVSLERISGILTVDVASWGTKGIGAVLAVGQTGSELFGEQILDSYGRTLDAIGAEGVTTYLTSRMTPFLQAAAAHFAPDKKTWTESMTEKVTGSVGETLTESLLGRTKSDEVTTESPAELPAAGESLNQPAGDSDNMPPCSDDPSTSAG